MTSVLYQLPPSGLLSFMNDTAPTLGSITSTDAEKKQLARKSKAFNVKVR